jgi:hypothetical protein
MKAPRVEIVALGEAAWTAGVLAEYDAETDTIRVDARAVACVRARLGVDEAERFVAAAVAHERHHRAFPHDGEECAHAAAQRASGSDPRHFEAALRAARA